MVGGQPVAVRIVCGAEGLDLLREVCLLCVYMCVCVYTFWPLYNKPSVCLLVVDDPLMRVARFELFCRKSKCSLPSLGVVTSFSRLARGAHGTGLCYRCLWGPLSTGALSTPPILGRRRRTIRGVFAPSTRSRSKYGTRSNAATAIRRQWHHKQPKFTPL